MDIEEVYKKNIGKHVGIGVELLASYIVDRMEDNYNVCSGMRNILCDQMTTTQYFIDTLFTPYTELEIIVQNIIKEINKS